MNVPGPSVGRLLTIAGLSVGFALRGTAAFGQIDAGYLADVKDLAVTITHSAADNATTVSLALAPPVASGGPGITLILGAIFKGPNVDVDELAEIVVRAHYRLLSDDRQRAARSLTETHALRMNLDAQDPLGITLDFFPVSWGYGGFAPPGDEVPVSYFTVSPADLRALAVAKTVTGEVLWTTFKLTPEELDAIRSFAHRVLPPIRPAG